MVWHADPVNELPARAADTSAESPWPVHHLTDQITRYIDRMPPVWVEGQIVQLNRRPGTSMAFLTLRDSDVDMSLPAAALNRVLDQVTTPLEEGAHVVVHAKPVFWSKRGSFQLSVAEIKPIGIGDLLARIEHLKRILAAEGLFDAERKVPLPFLPRVVGLICGRESKAEHDVVVNARARWPQVQFEIRNVAVQGADCVPQVSAAIKELDANANVDVIVVARGGGAVEDLLPFSNETLVRTASACVTPLVSAIGHETDAPLLDLVADFRASTPTDAAKRIVPNLAEERAHVDQALGRLRIAIASTLDHESERLSQLMSRPAMAQPMTVIDTQADRVSDAVARMRRSAAQRIDSAHVDLDHLIARLRTLSPQATLERGYAVVQRADGSLVRTVPGDVALKDILRVRVADGDFLASVMTLSFGAPTKKAQT